MTAPDFLLIIGAISGDNGESGTQVSFKRVTAICCEAGQEARFKAPNPISRGAKNAAVLPAIRGLSRARRAPNRVVPRSNALRPSDGTGRFFVDILF